MDTMKTIKEMVTLRKMDRRGNILVITMLILFAVSVIGGTMAVISSMDMKISGNQRLNAQAFFVAEAGLNEAIHRLSLKNPTNVTVGSWSGNAAIGDSEPYNPNWEARIYLTRPDAAPSGTSDIFTTGTLQDPSQPYLHYSEPNGTDGVLTIRHKWQDRDGDGVRDANEIVRYDPVKLPPENFTSGFPIEVITVTGKVGNSVRRIEAEVTRKMVVARTLGALYIDKAVRLTGNCAFCGYNHSVNTPPGTKPNSCFSYHLAGGHLSGVTTTGDQVKTQGSADVEGSPIPIDDASTNPFYSLAEVLGLTDAELNNLLSHADHTSITDPLNGITYITGDVHINSGITGEGLLYVTGDLIANGNFQYKGLIYVEGDVKITGTPWILGSIVVKGTSDWNFSAGNAGVLYSKDAISTALSTSMPCVVLSWRELD